MLFNKSARTGKELLYLFVAIVILSSVNALPLNASIVPYNQTAFINASVPENSTINVTLTNPHSKILYFFNASINASGNITIPVTFQRFQEFSTAENITSVFNVSYGNESFLYNLSIEVDKVKQYFIGIQNGEYFINASRSSLPKTDSLRYDIIGTPGERVNISCEGPWLSCPQYMNVESNSHALFDVAVSIPENASIGTYYYTVQFDLLNMTVKQNVTVYIFVPQFDFRSYDFGPECFVNHGDNNYSVTLECAKTALVHNFEETKRFLDSLQPSNETCEPEIEEKYIAVGNIEKDVAMEYAACKEERQQIRGLISEKDILLTTLQNDLNRVNEKLQSNESRCLEDTYASSLRNKEAGEAAKKAAFWRIVLAVIILAIAGVLAKMYVNWRREARIHV